MSARSPSLPRLGIRPRCLNLLVAPRCLTLLVGSMVAGLSGVGASPGHLWAQGVTLEDRAPSSGSAAAPQGRLQRLLLLNGTVHFGRVLDEGDPVVFELTDGEMVEVSRERIARIETLQGTLEHGEFWPADPNASRLFFAPTGRSLAAGSGTFNAYYGLLPFAAIGITDRLTIAGGTPLFFGDSDGRLFYLAPKFQIVRSDQVQVATGVLAFHFTDDSDDGTYLAYGVATMGSTPNSGLTAGVGFGRSEGSWSSRPALVLGADHRTSRRVKWMTENYLFPEGGSTTGLISGGVRIMGERLAADLALGAPVGIGKGFVFPLVNFSFGW
jgi:hypothetical protein